MSTTANDPFWRKLFLSAALFNWIAATAFILAPPELYVRFGVRPAPESTLYLHLFAGAAALLGYGYLIVSRNLNERAIVRLGTIAKLAACVVMTAHWLAGSATWHFPAVISVDLVYAAFFVAFLRQSRPAHH